jgi:hemoglobin
MPTPGRSHLPAKAWRGPLAGRRVSAASARFVELNVADPRIKAIFAEHDLVRLQRTLVENLQRAMREAHVSFAAQNRVLAKLAPMERDVTER